MAKVTFNEDLCKGCSLCESACPKKIIKLLADRLNTKGYHPAGIPDEDKTKCIGCAFCATMCPESIIIVER